MLQSFVLIPTVSVSCFQSVLDLLQRFKDSRFVSAIPEFEESWLNEFLKAIRIKSEKLVKDEDELLSKENFMGELREFLSVRILGGVKIGSRL